MYLLYVYMCIFLSIFHENIDKILTEFMLSVLNFSHCFSIRVIHFWTKRICVHAGVSVRAKKLIAKWKRNYDWITLSKLLIDRLLLSRLTHGENGDKTLLSVSNFFETLFTATIQACQTHVSILSQLWFTSATNFNSWVSINAQSIKTCAYNRFAIWPGLSLFL